MNNRSMIKLNNKKITHQIYNFESTIISGNCYFKKVKYCAVNNCSVVTKNRILYLFYLIRKL
jgi:hypothetical protein